MQKAGEAGFPKHNYSQLTAVVIHTPLSLDYSVFLGCISMVSLSGYTPRVKARARTCTPRALVTFMYYTLAGGAISIRDRISVPFHESVPKNRTLSSTGPLSVQ